MNAVVERSRSGRWPGLARLAALDRVLLAMILGIVALAAADPSQLPASLDFTLRALVSMAPYFAIAIALAAYAKASGADALVARAFDGQPAASVLMASLVGALSPFCSCGVIPLVAGMLAARVPLAPVMAFWIASPIMDPEMFILTAAGIGLDFTLAKTFATVMMGLLAGFAVLGLQRFGLLLNPLADSAPGGCKTSCAATGPARQAAPMASPVAWRFWREPARGGAFLGETRRTGVFLGKWLSLAFFLESLMVAYVPATSIAHLVGGGNAFAIPLAALVGVPTYLNGYAAIPLVAGLLEMGMSPGAAMTFVTSGAVSSIPAAVAVYALVRKPVFAAYVALGLGGSVLAGYAYQLSGIAI